jgi:hypothetical protein
MFILKNLAWEGDANPAPLFAVLDYWGDNGTGYIFAGELTPLNFGPGNPPCGTC